MRLDSVKDIPAARRSSTRSYCQNTGESAPVRPGRRIEVKVTGSGSYCENKAWQVSFRY